MPHETWEEVDVDYSTSDTVRSRGEGGFRSPPYYSYFIGPPLKNVGSGITTAIQSTPVM